MTSITLPKDKLNKVLLDVEVLVEDVALLLNQDEVVEKRLSDIEEDSSIGVEEEELDNYLEKRGVKVE